MKICLHDQKRQLYHYSKKIDGIVIWRVHLKKCSPNTSKMDSTHLTLPWAEAAHRGDHLKDRDNKLSYFYVSLSMYVPDG